MGVTELVIEDKHDKRTQNKLVPAKRVLVFGYRLLCSRFNGRYAWSSQQPITQPAIASTWQGRVSTFLTEVSTHMHIALECDGFQFFGALQQMMFHLRHLTTSPQIKTTSRG